MATLTTIGGVKDAARIAGVDKQKTIDLCAKFLGMASDDTECIVPDELCVILREHGAMLPGVGVICI